MLFLYFNMCLSVELDSLSCSCTTISLLADCDDQDTLLLWHFVFPPTFSYQLKFKII